ncbi:MAG: hypothetical protein JHC95_21295 [Solirubrobacteraceae bacterium]|nr:hypothetical protein [Solirubrobacteraceae bacterium]
MDDPPIATTASHHLTIVDAVWEDGPRAGGWIAERLGPFGPTVGHAVPLGYETYAVLPGTDGADDGYLPALDALLGVLGGFTGERPVHCGMWDGWSWWFEPGTDPGRGAGVYWDEGANPTQEEIDRAVAEAREHFVALCVERPAIAPLALPYRDYYVWTGPLRSATAFRHEPHNPPSLIWPEDRSWFVGIPIYSNEIAIAGSSAVIDAVVTGLHARRATTDDNLDSDD